MTETFDPRTKEYQRIKKLRELNETLKGQHATIREQNRVIHRNLSIAFWILVAVAVLIVVRIGIVMIDIVVN